MGYYTRFELDIIDGPTVEMVEAECEMCRQVGTTGRGILKQMEKADESIALIMGGETVKWRGHEDDMKAFSRKWPDTTLRLQGWGEEDGDIWVKYFKGGKMQVSKASISLDPFNPGALK